MLEIKEAFFERKLERFYAGEASTVDIILFGTFLNVLTKELEMEQAILTASNRDLAQPGNAGIPKTLFVSN